MDDLGPRLLELLGEPACRELLGVLELLGDRGCVELLAVLELPEPDRAALIGRLYAREQALAEVLADVEADSDDLVRLRLIGALREVLDGACCGVGPPPSPSSTPIRFIRASARDLTGRCESTT